MKLFNRTRVPDEVLEPLLVAAGRRVGARTAGVVVQVNQARYSSVSGLAFECVRVRWAPYRKRWINTDGGAFTITFPNLKFQREALGIAREFYKVAVHEWCHIREYQLGGRRRFTFSGGRGRRRPAHRHRPEERRVKDRINETAAMGRDENRDADVILALAVWLEQFKP